MLKINKLYTALILCCFSVFTLEGQGSGGHVPYSLYGLGEMRTRDQSSAWGMGETGVSLASNSEYGGVNPATLAYLSETSFEVGLSFFNSELQSPTDQLSNNLGSQLNYASLSLPLFNPINDLLDRKKKEYSWGLNFTLAPYSEVSYLSFTEGLVDSLGRVVQAFQGVGGINSFRIGTGFRYKEFALGVSANNLFGRITKEYRQSFVDDQNANRYDERVRDIYRGWQINLGAHYRLKLKDKKGKYRDHLDFGLSYISSATSRVDASTFGYLTYGRNNTVVDTLVDVTEERKGKLPSELRLGLNYSFDNQWVVSGSMTTMGWSEYIDVNNESNLDDNIQYGLGLSYTPDFRDVTNYWSRVNYILGASWGDRATNFNNVPLSFYQLDFTLGFPVYTKRQNSKIRLGVFYRDTQSENGILDESRLGMKLSYTMNDKNWFIKRKFD